jgi:hypothetical protein
VASILSGSAGPQHPVVFGYFFGRRAFAGTSGLLIAILAISGWLGRAGPAPPGTFVVRAWAIFAEPALLRVVAP